MSELIGLAYYAEIPAVIVDVQRTGPSTGMPTRTQQGDILTARTRRTATRSTSCCSRRIRGVLLPRGGGVRSGGALPDAGVHAVRPRHRHERLGVPALQVGRQLPPRPRPRAEAAELEKIGRNSTATPTRTPTTSRRARCPACTPRARSSRAARATTSTAATPRSPTSIRRSWTACCASTGPRRSAVPAPAIRMQTDATFGIISVGRLRSGACARRSTCWPSAASWPTTCASAPSRSARRSRSSSRAHDRIFVVEQNRDAQLKTLLTLETGVPKEKLQSMLRLRRLPAVEPTRRRRRHQPPERS